MRDALSKYALIAVANSRWHHPGRLCRQFLSGSPGGTDRPGEFPQLYGVEKLRSTESAVFNEEH